MCYRTKFRNFRSNLGWGRGWPRRNTLVLHMCYHTKFLSFWWNRLGVRKSGSQKHFRTLGLGPLGMGTWLTP